MAVLFCQTMAEATQMLEQYPVQLMLCDYYLKEGTAMEFLAGLAGRYPQVPRVLLSGSSEVVDPQLVSSGLVALVLHKPVGKAELTAVIESYIAVSLPVCITTGSPNQ